MSLFASLVCWLLMAQDATDILDKGIEAQQGVRPREEIADLYIDCDLTRFENNSRVTVSVKQYYKFADKRARDDKILTVILDLNAGDETAVKEAYNGKSFWVQNGEDLTVLDSDPVWQETKRGIRERLKLIQMFRRIFFLSSLKQEIVPIRRLENQNGLLRIEAKPKDPIAWGIDHLELAFDAESHHLRVATIFPLKDEKSDGAGNRLVDQKTHLEFRDYKPEINGQGLSVPEFLELRQENRPDMRLELRMFHFNFNQKVSDARFDPPQAPKKPR